MMPHLDHLFASIAKGDLNKLISQLKKNPQCVNAAEEEDITLLHYAVVQDRPEIVIYLSNTSDCKLAPQEKNYGHSPLHLACFHGNHRMAQHLLTKLNSEEINLQDKFGWTPLHHAVRNGHLDLCKTLLKSRAKPAILNSLGKTPLHYAAQFGYFEILKELYDLVPPSTVTPSPNEHFGLPVLTLLHLSALNNHDSIISWLQTQLYPPNVKCQRATHQNGDSPLEELAEDTALARGYPTLRNMLQSYRQQYESWIQDITSDHAHLGHVKLCLCGPPNSGKTCLKEALERSHFQLLLGDGEGGNEKRVTYGIDTNTDLQIGHDLYHVWDFSGDISHYSTHHFFLSTNLTLYTIAIDLTRPLPELRQALHQWMVTIKMHNIGSLSSYHHKQSTDTIKLESKLRPKSPLPQRSRTVSVPTVSRIRSRLSSVSTTLKPPKSTRTTSPSDPLGPFTMSREEFPGGLITSPLSSPLTPPTSSTPSSPSIFPVLALIIGSHTDLLTDSQKADKVQQIEGFLQETANRFHPFIEVMPQIVTMNCQKPSPSDMKLFKEHIGAMRATQMETEHIYPRIYDKIIKKIEMFKAQETKVMSFDEFSSMIQTSVNRLLSETQISYILNCLTNTGVVVYIEQGALSQWVFIDTSWLCHDILGVAQAPPTYPSLPLRQFETHSLTEQQITSSFPSCTSHFYVSLVPELLQHFEVCSKIRGTPSLYHFPPLSDTTSNTDVIWSKGHASFPTYIGRRLLIIDGTEYFPPGFFPRLQVQLVSLTTPTQSVYFNDNSIIIDSAYYQVLTRINSDDLSIDLIGRISDLSQASNCLQLVDQVQSLLVKVSRSVCPSIFFQWSIISAKELSKNETSTPHVFLTNEILDGLKNETDIWNDTSKCFETTSELLFFGCPNLKEAHTGRYAYVVMLHDEIFEKLEDLLSEDDELPSWKALSKQLNLSEYTELLQDKENPVKRLVMKWGEKPRWTVDSLLYALQEIKRKDAYNFVRAKMDKKYKN